jgi:hypothetical protein
MLAPATQPGESEDRPSGISGRGRWVILGLFIVVLLLVVCGAIFMRPVARVNRLLPTVELSRMPSAARNLLVQRQRRFFATRVTYIRFEAPADGVARFVKDSSTATADGPAPMASLSFGPRCPPWMIWDTTAQGRMYHWVLDSASVWLAVDDESHTVYVGVFESRSPWLRRLLD